MDNTLAQLINHIFDLEIENAQLKRQLEDQEKTLQQLREAAEAIQHESN